MMWVSEHFVVIMKNRCMEVIFVQRGSYSEFIDSNKTLCCGTLTFLLALYLTPSEYRKDLIMLTMNLFSAYESIRVHREVRKLANEKKFLMQ